MRACFQTPAKRRRRSPYLTVPHELSDKTVDILTRHLRFDFAVQPMNFLRNMDRHAYFVGKIDDRLGFPHFPQPAGEADTDWFRRRFALRRVVGGYFHALGEAQTAPIMRLLSLIPDKISHTLSPGGWLRVF